MHGHRYAAPARPSDAGIGGAEEGPEPATNPESIAITGGESLVHETTPDPLGGSAGSVGDPLRRLHDPGGIDRSVGRVGGTAGSARHRPPARRSVRRQPARPLSSSRRPRPRAVSRPSPCRTPGATTARCSTSFTAKYGIPINELNPDGSSGDEIEAIKANKDNPGPQAPDVIDVGLAFAPQAVTDGPAPAVQGLDLGHHPGRRQGRRRQLVRRLLRRPRRSRPTRPSSRTSRRTGPTC